MRLSRPIYESLPYVYMAIGGLAIFLSYVEPVGPRAVIAFILGVIVETAALTLLLRRRDCRELSRDYSGATIDLPSTLQS
jgi:hypothetical protein